MTWSDASKSFDAQTIGISSTGITNGGIIGFAGVMESFAIQWVVSNPDRFQVLLQLYGSLDGTNFYDLGADVSLAAGGTNPAPANANTLAVVQGKAALWVRAAVNLLSADPYGSPTTDGITVTAILVGGD